MNECKPGEADESGEPDRQIAAAHRLFDQQRFIEAASVFKKHPTHPISRYLLGEAYERAPEFSDKRFLALPHYLGAADEVPDFAAVRIGWCYASGLGVVKSARLAVHWYLIAGHTGVLAAYVHAAHILWVGSKHLERDRLTAYAWMFIASTLGDKDASEKLPDWFSQLTPAEEKKAYELALYLYAERDLWRSLEGMGAPGLYSDDPKAVAARQDSAQAIQRARSR